MGTPSAIDVLKDKIFGTGIDIDSMRDAIRTALQAGLWIVEFTKVSGEQAAMTCTLDDKYIPEDQRDFSVSGSVNGLVKSGDVLRVYSTDRGGWRSFKIANVQKWYAAPLDT